MKWLLVVMLSNGSSVPLDTYEHQKACESKALPMRIEIRSNQLEETSCHLENSGYWTRNGDRIERIERKFVMCPVNTDQRTNAICIPKG